MSEREGKLAEMVREASGIIAASNNKVEICKAMELVGFTAEERLNMRLYQQVRRFALKLLLVFDASRAAMVPAEEVNVNCSSSQVSALSSDERNPSVNTSHRLAAIQNVSNTPSPLTSTGSSSGSTTAATRIPAAKVP